MGILSILEQAGSRTIEDLFKSSTKAEGTMAKSIQEQLSKAKVDKMVAADKEAADKAAKDLAMQNHLDTLMRQQQLGKVADTEAKLGEAFTKFRADNAAKADIARQRSAKEIDQLAAQQAQRASQEATAKTLSAPLDTAAQKGADLARKEAARREAIAKQIALDNADPKRRVKDILAQAEMYRHKASKPLKVAGAIGAGGVAGGAAIGAGINKALSVDDTPGSVSPVTADAVDAVNHPDATGKQVEQLKKTPLTVPDKPLSKADKELAGRMQKHLEGVGFVDHIGGVDLSTLTYGDVTVVQKSNVSGQTLYMVKPEVAKRLGLNSSPVFNLPGDTPVAPKVSGIADIQSRTLHGDYYQQQKDYLQIASDARQSAVQAAMSTPKIQQMQDEMKVLESVAYAGGADAKRKLAAARKAMEAAQAHAEDTATKAVANNVHIQQLKVDLERSRDELHRNSQMSTVQPDVNYLMDVTGMDGDTAASLVMNRASPTIRSTVSNFIQTVRLNNGKPPKLGALSDDITFGLNVRAHAKQAEKEVGADPAARDLVKRQLDVVKQAREKVKAMLSAQLIPDKGFDANAAMQDAMTTHLVQNLLYSSTPDKYKAMLLDPSRAEDLLKANGVSKEQAQAELQRALSQMVPDPISREAGLTQAKLNVYSKQILMKMFPPASNAYIAGRNDSLFLD